jgi:uncharacterized coiled-coil DUF342 family protein
VQVERDSAREATRAARDAFMQCRAAYDERSAPLKKLQEQRQDANANANKLKANFRWHLGGVVSGRRRPCNTRRRCA